MHRHPTERASKPPAQQPAPFTQLLPVACRLVAACPLVPTQPHSAGACSPFIHLAANAEYILPQLTNTALKDVARAADGRRIDGLLL